MNNPEYRSTYENLLYNGLINVIDPKDFPRSFPIHWHKHVEMAVMPEDTDAKRLPVMRVNQTVYRLAPGDILFIWPGEVHETVENEQSLLIGLQFSSTILNELSDFTPFIHLFRTFHHIRPSDMPELAQRMQAHVRHILSIQQNRETFSGVETLICLYEMFMDFGTHIKNNVMQDTPQHTQGSGRTFEKISVACSYIIENCDRELTLESTADHIGFSACYFSRIFKQVTNYNFVEYLTLQRIKRAQTLLADSEKTITEISYQAGFKSISTFNRVFRHYRGCSPSEYRKYYLN